MSIRIDVQIDHKSASMRYVATAAQDCERLHEVGQYGGSEAQDEVFRKMAAWLKSNGYPAPNHYWLQIFP